jgi:hypothetical protein
MVFITYKKTEKNTFAIECSVDTRVSAILATLIECTFCMTQSTI